MLIIKKPTIIKAGEVTAGTLAKTSAIGAKKSIKNMQIATTTEVKPVRPPAVTPALDSIYADVGEVPRNEPIVLAHASAKSALLICGKLPSLLIKSAFSATPIIVPVVSKSVTRKIVKMIAKRFGESALAISRCIKVLSKPVGILKNIVGKVI